MGNPDAYTQRNNVQTLLIPIIEQPQAVENIDALCAHEDVHLIAFGVGDLRFALGERFEMTTASPDITS